MYCGIRQSVTLIHPNDGWAILQSCSQFAEIQTAGLCKVRGNKRRIAPTCTCMNLRGGGPCVVVATWDFGEIAVKEASKCLQEGKSAVDAAERGVMAVEQDDGMLISRT